MYHIALCDDNKAYLKQLESIVQTYCAKHKIDAVLLPFFSSAQLMDKTESKILFDIYILDIEMPNFSGIDLVNSIHKLTDSANIIFLSSFAGYAVEACGMNIFRYVLKERAEQDLPPALDRLFQHLETAPDSRQYVIANHRKFIKLYQRNIMYIYKEQKNAVFVLRGGLTETERLPLQEVYEKLDNPDMLYLDRGQILNLSCVRKVVGDRIFLDDGLEIISSRQGTIELKEALNRRWRGTL